LSIGAGIARVGGVVTKDEVVGRNVRAFREARGLSQAQVAEAAVNAGIPGFHPQTVLKVEKGTRALKFVEALTLAHILGVPTDHLYEPPSTATNDLKALQARRNLRRAHDALGTALREHVNARYECEVVLDLELSQDAERGARAAMGLYTDVHAVKSVFGELDEDEAEMAYGELLRELARVDEQSPVEAGNGNTVDMLTELEKRVAIAQSERRGQGRDNQSRRSSGG